MNKLKNATKRISAMGASAVMVTSAVFGAGLGNYPNNFVSNGDFSGTVVIGSAADPMDNTAAMSIIDDLKSEFSGTSERVMISYKDSSKSSASGSGERIEFTGKSDWNYGESNSDVRSSSFDEGDDDVIFADGEFRNDYEDEDYTQELKFTDNSVWFERAFRDDLHNGISDHLFIPEGESELMTYTFEITLGEIGINDNFNKEDFIGSTLSILDNDFTVTEIGDDTTKGISSLTLVGGAQTQTLNGNQQVSISAGGRNYDVSVKIVKEDKILLEVDGHTSWIKQYESEEIGGVTFAVTELDESDFANNWPGSATIIVGGNVVELEEGSITINDEDISDIYEDYDADVEFLGTGGTWEGFNVKYSLDDDIILEEGETFDDFVFGAFSLLFEGTNNPTFSTIDISATEYLNVDGVTIENENFNEDIAMLWDKEKANSPVKLIGDEDGDAFFVSDIIFPVTLSGGFNVDVGLDVDNGTNKVSPRDGKGEVGFNDGETKEVGNFLVKRTGIVYTVEGIMFAEAEGLRFLVGDIDEQRLWEFGRYNDNDEEIDFRDLVAGKSEDNLDINDIGELDEVDGSKISEDSVDPEDKMQLEIKGLLGVLAFENEALLDISMVGDDKIGDKPPITFKYNDPELDDDTDSKETILELSYDSDDEFDIKFSDSSMDEGGSILNGENAAVAEDDDISEYVDKVGTRFEYNTEDENSLTIHVPDEQVKAEVYLVTGEGSGSSSSSTMSVTVNKADADMKRQELMDAGHTIVGTEDASSSSVSVDINAPLMDASVAGTRNMIVVGGPAVNKVAASLLGLSFPTYGDASGVRRNEAVIRFFESSNSVLVYGYEAKDTTAAARRLNRGGLTGDRVNV